jgi:hypothetical protein
MRSLNRIFFNYRFDKKDRKFELTGECVNNLVSLLATSRPPILCECNICLIFNIICFCNLGLSLVLSLG